MLIPLALMPPAVVSVVAAILVSTDSWIVIGVEHAFGLPYADLRYQTATADCFRADPDWSPLSPTCDPFERANNYPTPWIWLYSTLGATESTTETVALIQMALFVFAVGAISWLTVTTSRTPLFSSVFITIAACAPPTWLALERGSTEVVIFFIVSLSWLMYAIGNRWVAAVALGIATFMKFYPVGAGFVFWRKSRFSWGPLITFLAVATGGVVLILADLRIILHETPQPTGGAFGSSLLLRMYEAPLPRVLGALMFVICASLYIWLLKLHRIGLVRRDAIQLVEDLRSDSVAAALVIYGGGVFTAAYVLGTNYDYRLIFLVFLVAGLALTWRCRVAKWLLVLIVLSLYGSYPATYAVEFAVDVLWVFLAPAIGLLVLFDARGSRLFWPSPRSGLMRQQHSFEN